jgi:hypothetical protein
MEDNDILNNIKSLLKIKTDKELSKFLNINYSNVTSWRNRNSFDYRTIINKMKDYDLNVIFKENYVNLEVESKIAELEKEIERCNIIMDGLIEIISKTKK